jgi:hypothetical protein
MVLPIRYARLTAEEKQLVETGEGGLLLANSTSILPLELIDSASASRASEQDTQLFHHLQVIDAKLNWLIERLGDEDKGLTSQGETLDIGGNGLCFLISETLAVGTLLRIKLKLSSTSLPVELVAKVLRVEPRTDGSGESSKFAIAVRFVEIGDVQREQIIKFIFDKERQALRRRKAKFASQD